MIKQALLAVTALLLGAAIYGCGDGLPPGTAEKNNMSMPLQDRIAAIKSNPNISDEEKARRIEFVKQKKGAQ